MVALEIALGTTTDSGRPSPVDGAYGTGESDLGRGAGSGGAIGEARDPGIAADGAGVLAARRRSERQKGEYLHSTGGASFGIMPKPWWPLISWWRSRQGSGCSMSLWSWKSAAAAFCTVTSRLIRLRPGSCSSFEKLFPAILPTDS